MRWGAALLGMAMPMLSGCFTVLGGAIGSAVPRYEDVGAVAVGATVRAETPQGTVKGDVVSLHATGFVLRDGDGKLTSLEYRAISFEKRVGSYAGTGAGAGVAMDVCVVAAAIAGIAAAAGNGR